MNPSELAKREVLILKADGKRESFDQEKLRFSLLHSGASEEATEKVIAHIITDLHDGMTTNEIYNHAFSFLHKISKHVARSYSLRRAVMDLGPAGFSFEKFVAEILKSKGFKTLTDQIVLGGCVSHEVDVVAWNEKKLIMIESKFHNELGTKSDLKVVLYVKARFDDLKDNVFNYGGKERPLDEGWLVTNTKFSSTAIHYGICKNMVMIGWNYPEKGNLQDMIEEEELHPITCLNSLSQENRRTLLESGIVLCSTVKKDPSLLKVLHEDKETVDTIIKEINEL